MHAAQEFGARSEPQPRQAVAGELSQGQLASLQHPLPPPVPLPALQSLGTGRPVCPLELLEGGFAG